MARVHFNRHLLKLIKIFNDPNFASLKCESTFQHVKLMWRGEYESFNVSRVSTEKPPQTYQTMHCPPKAVTLG